MLRSTALRAIAAAVLATGCKKADKPAPAPSPAPAVSATKPAPPVPKGPCAELRLTLGKDKLVHTRDRPVDLPLVNGAIDAVALGAVMGKYAAGCIGAVVVDAADDVGYQTIVTVLDIARSKGFADIGLGDGGKQLSKRLKATAPVDLATVPVVVVTVDTVTIGATKIPLAAADLEAQITAALPPLGADAPAGSVVLQADQASTGKTLNAIVRAAHAAGYDNVLFAVKQI